MDRMDVCAPRKRGDKTYWVRLGSAFPAKQGQGWNIVLDALPLPDAEGRCALSLFPAKPKDGGGDGGGWE